MLYKVSNFSIIYAGLLIVGILKLSYQQYFLLSTNVKCFSETRIISNTIQTFWHDISNDCKMNTTRLIQIYDKLLEKSDEKLDKFDVLLRHNVKKTIILEMKSKMLEAFKDKASKKPQIDYNLIDYVADLQYVDKGLLQNILDFIINEVFAFIDEKSLIRKLMQLELNDIHSLSAEKILDTYKPDSTKIKILPLLTFYITTVYKDNQLCITCNDNAYAIYNRLPLELRLLYESVSKTIVLINQAHLGYLPLLEASEKYFRILFVTNRQGLSSFGKVYGKKIKYLGSKQDQLIFYGKNFSSSFDQLWHVIWPDYLFRWNNHGFVMFQNKATKMLLCANKNYYGLLLPHPESEGYGNFFVELNAKENMLNNYCYWMFKDDE